MIFLIHKNISNVSFLSNIGTFLNHGIINNQMLLLVTSGQLVWYVTYFFFVLHIGIRYICIHVYYCSSEAQSRGQHHYQRTTWLHKTRLLDIIRFDLNSDQCDFKQKNIFTFLSTKYICQFSGICFH